MPRGKLRNNNIRKRAQVTSITCPICAETKKSSEFYASASVFHAGTGKVPYCKTCLSIMSLDDNGNIDVDKFKKVLKEIDKPYIHDLLQSAYNEAKNSGINNNEASVLGFYYKTVNSLPQYKGFCWADSIFEPDIENDKADSSFKVTDKLIDKWGAGYTNEEYYYFEKKWKKLIDNYGEKTSFHIEALITYIRFRVKEELATASGDLRAAKEWGTMAKDAATAAKINVSQLSKSDISGGVELLPQLFEVAESKVGIIPTLPKLKEQPYDDADMIIWSNINYLRMLEGKSRIEYRDIWNFYDQMLEEYYRQRGFSNEKIEEEKRKRNNVFRDLSEIYIEPEYKDSDS